jgi:hypothetical protein
MKSPVLKVVEPPDACDEAESALCSVLIFATGRHPQSGYRVFYEKAPLDVFPSEAPGWHRRPSGIVLEVVSPQAEFSGFKAGDKVNRIVIHYPHVGNGARFEQTRDLLLRYPC